MAMNRDMTWNDRFDEMDADDLDDFYKTLCEQSIHLSQVLKQTGTDLKKELDIGLKLKARLQSIETEKDALMSRIDSETRDSDALQSRMHILRNHQLDTSHAIQDSEEVIGEFLTTKATVKEACKKLELDFGEDQFMSIVGRIQDRILQPFVLVAPFMPPTNDGPVDMKDLRLMRPLFIASLSSILFCDFSTYRGATMHENIEQGVYSRPKLYQDYFIEAQQMNFYRRTELNDRFHPSQEFDDYEASVWKKLKKEWNVESYELSEDVYQYVCVTIQSVWALKLLILAYDKPIQITVEHTGELVKPYYAGIPDGSVVLVTAFPGLTFDFDLSVHPYIVCVPPDRLKRDDSSEAGPFADF